MTAPRSRRPGPLSVALAAATLALVGCSDAEDGAGRATTTAAATPPPDGPPVGPENRATIEMSEYAYAVSGALRAGTSTVALRNSGREYHMVEFNLLQPGKTAEDVRRALMSDDQPAFDAVVARVLDAPGAFLAPGRAQELTTALLPAGTYALACYIPAPGDGGRHFAKGMVTTLTVAEAAAGEAAALPEAGARYTVGDAEVEGPATLPAGRTTLAVTSSGAGPHELFVVRRRDPATTFEAVDKAFGDVFETESPPPPGYPDALPGVIVGNSFDVPAGTTVFLTVDLEPGSYFLGCAREPGEEEGPEAQEHAGELVEVTVA